MAPKGSHNEKGKATARAKMPTSVISRCLWLDRNCWMGFISELTRGLIWPCSVCGSKDVRRWDLVYDIMFLEPVTTCHLSQLQLMWQHHSSMWSPFQKWWAAFCTYMGWMIDKTRDQMNNCRWGNPHAFGDQVDRSNLQRTILGKIKCTGKHFSWDGSDDLRAKMEPTSCQ